MPDEASATGQLKHRSEIEDRQLDAMIQGLQSTHVAFGRMRDSLAPIVALAREMACSPRQPQTRPDETLEAHHPRVFDSRLRGTTSK